jgi:hypothetical protein
VVDVAFGVKPKVGNVKIDNVLLNLNKSYVKTLWLIYSKYQLSVAEISVLNKGLGFVPSAFKPSLVDIDKDIKRFERKLQLHFFFSNKEMDDENFPVKRSFKRNSNWWPKRLNGHITEFCSKVKKLLGATLKFKGRANPTKIEMTALKNLSNNKQIVIKKCDKGGGIAVTDSSEYVAKINSMLNDPNVYTRESISTIRSKLKVKLTI